MAAQSITPPPQDGPRVTYKALWLIFLALSIGLALALITVLTIRDALPTIAFVLAVLSLGLQVQFYLSQEGAQRQSQAGIESMPERVAARLADRVEAAKREAMKQSQASAEESGRPDRDEAGGLR